MKMAKRAKRHCSRPVAWTRKRLLVECLESRRLLAGMPELIGDIEHAPHSSSPATFARLGEQVLLAADHGINGRELWVTDGTSEGTELLLDINPGGNSSNPASLVQLGGFVYFAASHPTYGNELWRSDGTAGGTQLVKDISLGSSGSSPEQLTIFDGRLYFSAFGSHGRELWVSDGTAEGTSQVADIYVGSNSSTPIQLTVWNDTLFFSAFAGGTTGRELWKTDGTSEGTELVRDIVAGTGSGNPAHLVAGPNQLFFVVQTADEGSELWSSDGTAEGTVLLKDILAGPSSSNPEYLTILEGILYFAATDSSAGRELWRSDGTSEGTFIVADIIPGASASSTPFNFLAIEDTLYFSAVGNNIGRELWKTDGTSEGTVLVTNLAGASSSSPQHLRDVAGTLFFTAVTGEQGRELWKSDGTSEGTVVVADILLGTASADPLELMVWDDLLLFSAISSEHGRELWISDGTAEGTQLVKDINTKTQDSSPERFYSDGGTLYFSATTQGAGRELWRTDGPSATTVMLLDSALSSNNGNPGDFIRYGDYVYFAANSSSVGRELWRTDGTPEGTEVFADIHSGGLSSSPNRLIVFDGYLYFVAEGPGLGAELWRTDGTLTGTVQVADIRLGSASSTPDNFVVVGDTLYFTALTNGEGRELWKTDGTTEGTSLVRDIRTGGSDSSISNIVPFGDSIVFVANDGVSGSELWISNGTTDGTMMLVDLQVGTGSSSPASLTAIVDQLYFVASVSGSGRELWRTDGTAEGTQIVADIVSGSSSSSPESLTNVNDALFFTAATGSGRELWKSDGTAIGTVLVKDIRPGSSGASPSSLVAVGESLFFAADDGVLGAELWSSDGTVEGTQPVVDLRPEYGSFPTHLFADGDRALVFTADDGVVGREGWRFMVGTAPTNVYLDNIYVAENQSSGTVVGTLHTVDSTEDDTFTYELVVGEGDADNAKFAISGGQLVTAESLDFESRASYSVRVRTTDALGETFEKRLVVRTTDVNDAPQMTMVELVQSAALNTPYVLDYAALFADSNAQDQDEDLLLFVVQGIESGTLTKNGQDVVVGETTLGPGEQWVWTPPQDALGNVVALELIVTDGQYTSLGDVPVTIKVLPWTLFVSFADDEIDEASPVDPTTLTVRRVGDLTSPLVVSLQTDASELAVPSTITIPAGQSTVTVPVMIANDGEIDGSQSALLTASADGYPTGEDSILVHDDDSLQTKTIGGALVGSLASETYVVIQDLSVQQQGTLVIDPGAQLRFATGKKLSVSESSTLTAIGTATEPIVFTSHAAIPMAGDWDGIIVSTLSAPRSEISYAEIVYATTAIRNGSFNRFLLDISHSEIHQIADQGIQFDVGYGAFLSGADARVLNNTIHHIGSVGVLLVGRGISGSPPSNGGNSARVEGNEIYQTDTAIRISSSYAIAGGTVGAASASPSVVGNWLHDNRGGISGSASKPSSAFGSSWAGGTIANNLITDNTEFGIQFTRNSGQIDPKITNNTIVGNGTDGISHAFLNPSGLIRNNNVVGNGNGIRLTEVSTLESGQVGFNNVWDNETNWSQYPAGYGVASDVNANGTAIDAHSNMSEDPRFMDWTTNNYRLRVTSPLIDAGTDSQTPTTDFDGLVRDAIRDIGAFEKFSLPPQQIVVSSSAFNENMLAGSEVAVLSSVDPDIDDFHSYTLVAGEGDDDNLKFTISGDRLLLMSEADYEMQTSFTIRVRSTDLRGETVEQSLTMQIVDLPEVQNIQVGDGSDQRSAVGQLVITFDGLVTIGAGAFLVVRLSDGGGSVNVSFATSTNGQGNTVATLTFSGNNTRANGLLVDGNYQLAIDGSKILRSGRELDGDQDGIAGGEFVYGSEASDRFFALYGDLNGDRTVNLPEFNAFRASFGRVVGDSAYRAELDFDGDGLVGLSDFNQFRSRFGRLLEF